MGQGGEWGFIAFFALPEGGDAFQMQPLLDLPQSVLQCNMYLSALVCLTEVHAC
jgi:hypothetical protein